MPSKLLDEIKTAVGLQAALVICRRWGGRILYVPASVNEFHPISLAIGYEAAAKLCSRFAGGNMSIPAEANILLDIRNEMILEDRGQGLSLRVVALRYGISERMVRKIEEKARNRSALPEETAAGEN